MNLKPTSHWDSRGLRGLYHPVRSLGDASEDIVRNLLIELLNPTTTRHRQRRISDRLVLVRRIVGERTYTGLAQKIMASLIV